jgi:hypothetical protein
MWGKGLRGRRAHSRPESNDQPISETDLQPKDPREGIDQADEHNPVNPQADEIT